MSCFVINRQFLYRSLYKNLAIVNVIVVATCGGHSAIHETSLYFQAFCVAMVSLRRKLGSRLALGQLGQHGPTAM
jgi:hypothetical protein